MQRQTRRSVLRLAAAGVAASLAGCSLSEDADADADPATQSTTTPASPEPTADCQTPTPTATPVAAVLDSTLDRQIRLRFTVEQSDFVVFAADVALGGGATYHVQKDLFDDAASYHVSVREDGRVIGEATFRGGGENWLRRNRVYVTLRDGGDGATADVEVRDVAPPTPRCPE